MKSIAAEVVETGERRDSKGRRIESGVQREALLRTFDQSGLTQRAFALREGIKFGTFASWLAKRRSSIASPVFQEISLPLRAPTLVEVVLPSGITIRGESPDQVTAIVLALRKC